MKSNKRITILLNFLPSVAGPTTARPFIANVMHFGVNINLL